MRAAYRKSAGDARLAYAKVLGLLGEMNATGLTLVVVTHDPAVARRARRVLVLQDGHVFRRVDGAHVHEAVEALSREENEA